MADPKGSILVTETLSQEDIDLFGEYRYLIPITIKGRRFHVPEGSTVLRALQYLEIRAKALSMKWGEFCWNDTVGCCELTYRAKPNESVCTGRGCQLMVEAELEILDLPKGGVFTDEED